MADLNKFEQMLEKLVNEDKVGAEELFHEIVVEKSRDIYESLLESDLEDDEVDEATDEEVDESEDEEVDESEDDAELDEDFNLDEFEVEADPMDAMMGDMEPPAADDMASDMDMGGEESADERIDDLEDALEELKAEFEKMMSGDDSEEAGDEMDMGDEEADDEMDMGDEEPEEESYNFEATDEDDKEVEEATGKKSEAETMREYVEKVTAKMGDNGVNNKSTVAGKNDMGGTTANLRGGESKGEGTKGGLAAPTPKEDNAGNVNVPGAKGATKTASQPGHGAEKKGKPEQAANTKPVIGK
jgi:midasin